MRRFATNLLSLEPQNVSSLVVILALAVWLGVLASVVHDIFGHHRSVLWKACWLLCSCVPAAGVFLYALFRLLDADWRAALHWKHHDSVKGSRSKSAAS